MFGDHDVPARRDDNGVKGEELVELARTWFEVDIKMVPLRHSTLGGNNSDRAARRNLTQIGPIHVATLASFWKRS